MRLRTSLTFWSATFFSTLGLSPLVACGGVMRNDGPGGSGGDGAGGNGGNAGSGTGGQRQETGGYGTGGFGTGGGYGDGGYGTGGEWPSGGAVGYGGSYPSTGGAGGALPTCVGTEASSSGYEKCIGGSIHRYAELDCAPYVPRQTMCQGFGGGPSQGGCVTDADCNAGPRGYCELSSYGEPSCYCSYGCVRDADCSQGEICLCGGPGGQCVAATCTSDADCGSGLLCLSYVQNPGCGGTAFACQTPYDQCVSDADCSNGPAGPSSECTYQNGIHVCQTPNCATAAGAGGSAGRPFLVEGSARTAEIARRRDWSSNLCPVVDGLGSAVRAELATRWTEVALMEHASIAAFARFALEIMSLGAPPALLVATHAAMADETVHARDAFALASAYAGHAVGPSALDVGAALLGRTPLDIVRTAILEGCIGETVAAVEAAEALAHATDPAVRAALERVVVDETKHAELAWQFVKWVLDHADTTLAQETATCLVTVIESELARETATSLGKICRGEAAPGTTPQVLEDQISISQRDRDPRNTWRSQAPAVFPVGEIAGPSGEAETNRIKNHGTLDDATRSEIRRRVVADVIAPCARALALQSRRNKNLNDPSVTVAA